MADVKRRDGYRCQGCGSRERLCVDHRTPHDRYAGSFYDKANLWVLCQSCNNSKRDLDVREWREALARRKRPATPSLALSGDYSIGGTRP